MAAHALDALFRPRSLAIVGASNDPNKVGGRPLAFLKKCGWTGALYPINPSADEVQGVRAWRSVRDISAAIDQAIIAVPSAHVLDAADQCLRAGARVLQIFSAGFGEGDNDASARALVAKARKAGARVLGPNSLGLFNTVDGFFGTFATALDGAWPRPGRVAVATQSGAFGSYFFGLAEQRGVGLSNFVATGNESDIDIADCVDFFGADAATRIVVVALEGCRDGRKLARALAAARASGKAVFAMKVGASQAGARAAATHTGALTGGDQVFDAMLRSIGVHRAASLDALVDAAYAASTTALPCGRKTLVVTTSGGIGVLAADAAEACGLSLPEVSSAARDDIRRIAPLAAGNNPVDTSAGILGDLAAYARIAERALGDRPFDAVLCFMAHIARNRAHWQQLRQPLLALRARFPRTTFVAVLLASPEIAADLEANGFAVFSDPSRAIAAIAACAAAGQDSHSEICSSSRIDLEKDALEAPFGNETEAQHALGARGITFAPEAFVRSADEAVVAAHRIGYPVVLKIVSADIAHKTEAGGVALGLRDDTSLRSEVAAMRERVLTRRAGSRIEGFIVARQLEGGVELIVGTQNDAVFGPVITVGAGGVLAELVADVAIGLAPVDAEGARAMLGQTRVMRLLAGYRGAAPADIDALVRQIVRLSEIAFASRERIAGIDLNPVLARPDGAFALDALVAEVGEPS